MKEMHAQVPPRSVTAALAKFCKPPGPQALSRSRESAAPRGGFRALTVPPLAPRPPGFYGTAP